ncbi:Fe2+ transport system protein FeoA [Bradyrhizobium sp. LM2.7]
MRRRDFIMLVASAAAYPLGASAQGNVRRIGVMAEGKPSDPESQASYQKLRQRLGELGWEQGRNIQIEYRWWAGDPALADAQAAELAGLRPDVLLAISTPSVEALKRHAPTLPIVFTVVADPVGAGFVQSLGKPGGNITGFTTFEPEMAGKWLQLLKQAAPEIRRIAAVFNPRTADLDAVRGSCHSGSPAPAGSGTGAQRHRARTGDFPLCRAATRRLADLSGRVSTRSPAIDSRLGGHPPSAGDVSVPFLRQGRRADVVRNLDFAPCRSLGGLC